MYKAVKSLPPPLISFMVEFIQGTLTDNQGLAQERSLGRSYNGASNNKAVKPAVVFLTIFGIMCCGAPLAGALMQSQVLLTGF